MNSLRNYWASLCLYSVVIMLVYVNGNRELSFHTFYCPASNCTHNSSIIWVAAKTTDNSSTIHYLWTTYPVPTIVVAYTTLQDVEPLVNWSKLTNDSLRVSGLKFVPAQSINYTFGLAIPRIYEYDDDDDNVDLNDNTYMVVHKFTENTEWQIDLDKTAGQVTYTANDSIIFKFVASRSEDRESQLPHQKYTANSNRFSLTLDHMNVTTNSTRFAVELNYIVDEGSKPDVTTERNFDDEFSPAVFKTVYAKVGGKHGKAYTQWKPIAYTKADLGRKYQTRAVEDGIENNVSRSWNIGEVAMDNFYSIYGLNVSFGLAKDGFYQKNKYLTWSGIVGYGEPATEPISFLIILMISIGLGLPLGVILFGGAYYQIRKQWKKSKLNTSYGRIN